VLLAVLELQVHHLYTCFKTGQFLPLIFAVLLLRCNFRCSFSPVERLFKVLRSDEIQSRPELHLAKFWCDSFSHCGEMATF